jgi:hypothetical protein
MKITQYLSQEKAIASADTNGIRQRWLWGLRLLRDPQAISPGGGGLRHGVADELIRAAAARGFKLSAREIRWRLQAARTYPTDLQIGNAITDFETWFALIQAGFPAILVSLREPAADHRTDAERHRDNARALLDVIGEQGSLFPLRDFEPTTTTLKELQDYTAEQEELTARFAEHGRKRRAYLDSLIGAVAGDLSVTWEAAQRALGGALDSDTA